jgi:endonuclease IV
MLGIHVAKISKVLESTNVDKDKNVKMKVRKTLFHAIKEEVEELNLTAVQIYTHGPRNYRANIMDHDRIGQYVDEKKLNLIVHGSYVSAGLWNVTEENKGSKKSKAAVDHLRSQLQTSQRVNACGLVIHVPRKPVKYMVDAFRTSTVRAVIDEEKVPILLEMMPVKEGKNVDKAYVTPKQVNALVNELDFLNSESWGICVDTAHLWGGGVDVSKKSDMQSWLDAIESPNMIKLFHLNGSQDDTWNSGRDVHHIVFGNDDDSFGTTHTLKKAKKTGVYPIIKFCMAHNIPVICEINRGSEDDVRASLRLINQIAELH